MIVQARASGFGGTGATIGACLVAAGTGVADFFSGGSLIAPLAAVTISSGSGCVNGILNPDTSGSTSANAAQQQAVQQYQMQQAVAAAAAAAAQKKKLYVAGAVVGALAVGFFLWKRSK